MDWIPHALVCRVLLLEELRWEARYTKQKKLKTFNDVYMCAFECGFVHVSSGA